MPRNTLSGAAAAEASILRISISPPPVYTELKSNEWLPSSITYFPNSSTNRPPFPVHCCIHMHEVSATLLSCCPHVVACTPMNSASRVAVVGLFGSFVNPSPVRKGLHAPITRVASASAIGKDRFMIASRLAVEGEGDVERARLRVIEVINPGDRRDRTAQARLRVVPGVFGPGVQIATRDPDIDAAYAQRPRDPRRVERVGERDLPQLRVAAVFDARLVDAVKGTGSEAGAWIAIPVLPDRDRVARARTHDRTVPPAALSERLRRAAVLGVLMRTVAIKRALGAVPNLAAVSDVEQAGHLELLVAEAASQAARPAGIGIGQDAWIRVGNRETSGVDVQSSSWRSGAGSIEDGVRTSCADAAPHQPDAADHAELLAHHRDVRLEVADRDELRAAQRQHHAAVTSPLQTELPPVVRPLNRPHVERDLEPAVAERGGVLCLEREPRPRRRHRRQQNDVLGLGVVVREAQVRLVAEQADVEPGLEFLGALGTERVGALDRPLHQATKSRLRRRFASALRDAGHDRVREEVRGREIGLRFLPRLAVGDPQLAERQPRPLTRHLRERPGQASLGEP